MAWICDSATMRAVMPGTGVPVLKAVTSISAITVVVPGYWSEAVAKLRWGR